VRFIELFWFEQKVASKAMKRVETTYVEDVKEYADAYTQHELSEFTTSLSAQTDPEPERSVASFSIQTETEEGPSMATECVQTEIVQSDIPLPVVHVEAEVQTDAIELSPSRSPTPDPDMASSSSTLLPPTPKQTPKHDLPPSYAQIEGTSAGPSDGLTPEMRDALQKLHNGLHLPLTPVPGGVSEDALEEWAALKDELGFDCTAIDKILEISTKNGRTRAPSSIGVSSEEDGAESSAAGARRYARKNRFYNIYNTFVYGSSESPAPPANPNPSFPSSVAQSVLILGLVGIAAGMFSAHHAQYTNIPGGPTYYDRAAWSEFNRIAPAMEGFANDGAASVWDFMGRVAGGAARLGRGWPT
jgi:hypothetical protein